MSSGRSWRFQPTAILPLALLLPLGLSLTELTTTYLLRDIRCFDLKLPITPGEQDPCRLSSVSRAYSRDLAIFQTTSTLISIVVAGLYGTLSDTKGRRYAMAWTAGFTALGDVWLALTGK